MEEKKHNDGSLVTSSDVVQLSNDSGELLQFYHIGTIEYNDEWYAFFQPAEPLDGVDPDEIVIFKIGGDSNDEVLLPIGDEELYDEVYEEFMRELAEDDEEGGCSGNCASCSGCSKSEW